MRGVNKYFGIASFIAIACFIGQLLLLGLVFKNIRTLSLASRKPYIFALVIMIVSMVVCNNFILPETTSSEETARIMLFVFNGLTFISLVLFHFVIELFVKEKSTK
jgi:hypothetical protein